MALDDKQEEELRDTLKKVRDENAKWRLKHHDLEEENATVKASLDKIKTEKDTAATELEKIKTESKETIDKLTAEHTAKIGEVDQAAKDQVKAARLEALALREGLIDLDGLKLLDLSKITQKDDGTFEGVDEVFKAAKEAKPYLFGQKQANSSTPGQNPKLGDQKPVDARKLTDEEYKQQKAALIK